jgi:hypothetical protein
VLTGFDGGNMKKERERERERERIKQNKQRVLNFIL